MAILVTLPSVTTFIVGRRVLVAAVCIAVASLIARPATAQYDTSSQLTDSSANPVSVVVGGDVSHDSNLFRQPSAANPTSDTISVAYIGLRIDKQYSLQRFQLDITETIRRYDRTTRLNFDSLDYRGAWIWQVGPRLSGTLSADRRESLVPFEDVLIPGNTLRNIRVSENRAFTLDAWAFGDWHLLFGIYQTTQKSDQTTQIQPDFKADGYEAGIKYAVSSGSWISAIRRSSSGDYLNQGFNPVLGSGYRQDESELKAYWIASGKSKVTSRITWLDRTQNGAAQRDFSGLTGELVYSWMPTGKLSMDFIAKRDITPLQDFSGSYVASNTLSIAPTWAITSKTSAHLAAARTTYNFAGAASGPVVGPPRKDTLNFIEIGVDWSPANRLMFGISVQHQARDSNDPRFEFKDTIARITGSYRF